MAALQLILSQQREPVDEHQKSISQCQLMKAARKSPHPPLIERVPTGEVKFVLCICIAGRAKAKAQFDQSLFSHRGDFAFESSLDSPPTGIQALLRIKDAT